MIPVGAKVRHKLTGQIMTVKNNHNHPAYTLALEKKDWFYYIFLGVKYWIKIAICHYDNLEDLDAQLKLF